MEKIKRQFNKFNPQKWGFVKIATGGFFILGFIAAAMALLAVTSAVQAKTDLQFVYEQQALPTAELQNVIASFKEISFRMAGYLGGQFPAAGTKNKIQDQSEQALAGWKKYKELISSAQLTTEEQELIKKSEDFIRGRLAIYIESVQNNLAKEDKKAIADNLEEGWPEVQVGLLKPAGKLLEMSQEHVHKAYVDAQRQSKMILMVVVGLSIIVLSAFMTGIYFIRSASRRLTEAVNHLGESTDIVESETEGLQGASDSLARSTEDQAAAVQQTAASIAEISSMIATSSQSVSQSESAADRTNQAAESGKIKSASMLSSITDIEDVIGKIIEQLLSNNKKIEEISSVISEISSKTSVINDIVFQTKLLSFNASVEAARAGENGKGFAVVAEEVGNLAQMSGAAAKEIRDMLNMSIDRVNGVVAQAKSSVSELVDIGKKRMSTGANLANETSGILLDIAEQVSTMKSMAFHIAEATKEETRGVEEINKAMGQIDLVTQRNSLESNKIAEASLALKKQMNLLRNEKNCLVEVIWGKAS